MRTVLDIVSLFRAARYAMLGVWAAARHQVAFRRELILAAVLVPIGVWLGDGGVELTVDDDLVGHHTFE